MAYIDAIALAVYAVVGADKALAAGYAPIGAVVIGMTNAVGGGLLRDILVREEPLLFKPGQFYVLAASGAVCCLSCRCATMACRCSKPPSLPSAPRCCCAYSRSALTGKRSPSPSGSNICGFPGAGEPRPPDSQLKE